MEAISKKLELATNVAVLCLVVLFVGRLALGVANHREIPKSAPTVPPSLIQPKMPRDAAFEQAPRTLVLVLSSECHFCQKSVPELATLST